MKSEKRTKKTRKAPKKKPKRKKKKTRTGKRFLSSLLPLVLHTEQPKKKTTGT
jgi:hypothetical protein